MATYSDFYESSSRGIFSCLTKGRRKAIIRFDGVMDESLIYVSAEALVPIKDVFPFREVLKLLNQLAVAQ